MAPLLMILFVVAAVAGVSQFGLVFSSEALSLKLEKLNPVEGVKRMFNLRSFVTLIMSLGKVALVLIVAYFSFKSELFASKAMAALSSGQVTSHICQASIDMMLRLAAVLLILALADYWYQRFQWEKDLRMTKQEVKEEMRDTDGDPHVKSKRRQIQRQLAMQRMMSEVPEAEVVVRNPTHFAVALKYDAEKDPFPYVVAKGMDRVAMKIIKIAFEHNVPVKYSPELARELHKLELGDSIPNKLWKPVVEVLAWVYKGSKADKLREKLQAERRVTEVENA
jgi:flagellar biosynthetic protein FlhB